MSAQERVSAVELRIVAGSELMAGRLSNPVADFIIFRFPLDIVF